jgi:phospholipase C
MTDKRINSFGRMTRRRFVGSAAAVAGAAGLAGVLPESLARAASATPPKSFDLSQVKHLVFLMQENRSFDHYFGTFPGVRGFSDPTAIKLPTGRSVFQQPDPANPDGYLEPWHMSTITTGAAAVPSLSHDWRDQHAAWNQGAMDGWLLTHIAADGDTNGSFTMGHYTQEDIPFHWALARAFTLCDNYHCSVLGPTDANRLFWETGTIDPQGLAGGPVLEAPGVTDLTYETGAETMYNAGISFKFYEFDDSYLSTQRDYFKQFQTPGLVPAALYNNVVRLGYLYGDGTPGGIGNPLSPTLAADPALAFEEDCANGTLPDVSYIGTGADEHPPDIPASGARFIASILEALAANEDIWNTTVFVLNYDENDGFFDHVPPPVPNIEEYPEEFVTKASPAGTPGGGLPVGAGFRVPAIIISPWTTGGQIFSQVSDHTSCLQLIEAVANAGGFSGNQTTELRFPNISPWRRKTFSDFTGALRPVRPRPAPSNPQLTVATTTTLLAAQEIAARQPMPTRPGAAQAGAWLDLSPAYGLDLAPGASATVSATFGNNGPGPVSKVSLTLSAPSGWTVTRARPTTASAVAAGKSLTASWQVTAPPGSGSQAAALSATASYTDATGAAKTVTAQQSTLAPGPVITSVSPSPASPGDVVTVSGVNFGATQGSGYVTVAYQPNTGITNQIWGIWGGPGNPALTVNSWSDSQITFTAPTPSAEFTTGEVWVIVTTNSGVSTNGFGEWGWTTITTTG